MNHTLEIDGIRLSFGERIILSDIYLKCQTGKVTGLLGCNGQGKTCLFNSIYGDRDIEKSVRIDSICIHQAFKHPELIRFLPQFGFFPGSITIAQAFRDFQVSLPDFISRFPEFGERGNTLIRKLSGGQRRLVQTYLVIKAPSQFVILDEPFTHLMPMQIEKAVELITEEKANKGFLITDHMYQTITGMSDTLYLLANGKTNLITDKTDLARLGYIPE